MRLNQYLARCGLTSRRGADALVRKGGVTVNRIIVDKPFFQVDPDDRVCFQGKLLSLQNFVYFAFHKPVGITTSKRDRFAEKLIIDYLPKQLTGVVPVGRLDKNSSGLIILTNDGDFCYRITHPKFEIEKEYSLTLTGMLSAANSHRALAGVIDQGEKLSLNRLITVTHYPDRTMCRVVICEGKKRHLRRLFAQLGHRTISLQRVRIARLRLGQLKPGEYTPILPADLGSGFT